MFKRAEEYKTGDFVVSTDATDGHVMEVVDFIIKSQELQTRCMACGGADQPAGFIRASDVRPVTKQEEMAIRLGGLVHICELEEGTVWDMKSRSRQTA